MEHASPEEYDDASDRESVGDEHEIKAESDSSPTSPDHAAGKNAPAVKPPMHLQKRRRVTRACDECRRKKIKCDGKQPCTHCTVYSYECTYDQPSNRRRNPAPQYVENLEHRVHRAESLLHILIPNLDLNDPGIDAAVAQGWIPGAPGKGHPVTSANAAAAAAAAAGGVTTQEPRPPPLSPISTADRKPDTKLESMIRAVAQLDLDESGHWDYHGHSSGLSFMRRMREQLGDLMGPDMMATPFVKTRSMSQVLESPKSAAESPLTETSPTMASFPPKETARKLCGYAINDAAALLRTVHQPTFWAGFERLYSTSPDHYTNEDNVFLPLFYSAVALGCLYGKDDDNCAEQEGYESAIQQGVAYFKTARHLMDITDCRDLSSIQAVVLMTLFLQSSAKMSQCYAYVGVALRSALRMGLHRATAGKFDPVEAESRKRVFWIVRKMDIYVGAMLGLPQTLSDDDIDQEFPIEVDDEYITRDGILPMPEGTVSVMTAFNAHTRLVEILQTITRKIYPIKVQSPESPGDKSYSIPFSTIRDIEGDLEEWKQSLPPILSPCEAPSRYTRMQHLLRLSYAHAQVLLYRPFLHFTAMEKRSKAIDQRAYACAASFINVSRNIVHIASQMKQNGLLNGAFWFIMYTTFFSVLALVYFAAENPDNPTTDAVMKDALEGKEVLAALASKSMAADRCSATLNMVFQRLPAWMRDGQQNPIMSKKRPHEPHLQPNAPLSRGHTDLARASQENLQNLKRASTLPKQGRPGTPNAHSPFESNWSQSSSSYGPHTPTTSYESNGPTGVSQPGVSSLPLAGGVPQYQFPPKFPSSQLADLSTMMFPTADEPFVYPNQPLTTFENNHFAKNQSFMNPPQPYNNNNNNNNSNAGNGADAANPLGATSRAHDEHIEAQFYALPPYIEHAQQQQLPGMPPPHPLMAYPPASLSFTNGQAPSSAAAVAAMQMSGNGNGHANGNGNGNGNAWPGQQQFQQDLSQINIQDLFGGAEWNPMFQHPGYQASR